MNLKTELRPLILVALVAFVVFANTLGGDFVYDDNRQILRNPLIQDAQLYGRALVSDVWAFKSDGAIAASNYYRPTFVAWLIVSFRLFGASPFGWHAANVLLHVICCLLAYLLLRRLRFSAAPSFAAAVVFAVHPVHTESVAWISGSPDLLFAAALFGALWFALNRAARARWYDLPAAGALFALALGAKEAAMMCVPVFYLIFALGADAAETDARREGAAETDAPRRFPLAATLPFAALAAAFFALRWAVIGRLAQPVESAPDFASALLTAPSIFVFYFRQLFFPLTLAENYPLRPVAEIGFAGFFLPLLAAFAIAAAIFFLARRSRVRQIGAALLLCPLLPVLNAASFPFDQIVHDRYLYVPLFGLLIMLFSFFEEGLRPRLGERAETALAAAALVVSLPLAAQTFAYNRVWRSDLALWTHNAAVDPANALSFVNYGSELSAAGRYAEAVDAFSRSIENRPSAIAYTGRARNLLALGKFDEAVADLRLVVAMPPEATNAYALYQAYEALALALAGTNRADEAAANLRQARRRLPIYAAALSEKLAVVLYQSGDKAGALRELEDARAQARTELLPESKTVLLRLGMLYAETGRRAEAKAALAEYLALTSGLADNLTLRDRQAAAALLRQLN